ncbi:TPA: relaxase/mobilization nuclease domain-containing protein [Escherichia coli]|nr:relaxase/mobilization nuclease domain-containing protein [Escherichia coli]
MSCAGCVWRSGNRGRGMIVKFHARGKGGGSGPVDYLLGRERNREGATVLQGNPEEVRELIDATPFAKKYTSGVLSFAEKELPPGGREKVMASFERVLMPGLEKNQYSILWVEHQDKGRLELNFVIPNMELQTGKRLQPYYDRADRPRIDAWQTLVNHHYGLHDPNAPENRRTLTLPDNLPETKQALAEGVTRGIDALYHAGEIKGRQDVIQALTEAGLEVVRVTRSSISIADPNGGRNIRLKGAFYEQSFTDGRGVREKAERESRIYRENAERRVQEARRICKQGTDLKRIFNQERYQRPYNSPERTAGEVSENDRRYDGRALENRTENERETLAVADYRLSTDVCHDRESAVVPGHEDKREYEYSPRAERESGEAEREDMGRALSRGQQRTFSGVAEGDESRNELDEGQRQTERIRATATGLYAAAERMGERLRGIAENVFAYATGQRDAERASHAVESAGAALERADRTLEPVIQREQEIRDERLMQEREHELSLERERQPEIQERTLDGPSLGW